MTKFIAALLLCLLISGVAVAEDAPTVGAQLAAVRADENAAIEKVVKIVNQPVTHLKRDYTPGMVSEYSPGWFHKGAETPDFNTVDVRLTQEFPYAAHPYVSSDLNPTEMFIGAELEFNAMTKYFYTDRRLPKKKLTQAEMIEINRLYRIIGADEKKIADLRSGPRAGADISRFAPVAASIVALSLAAFFFLKMKRKT